MTTTTIDLTKMTPSELARVLRDEGVSVWNAAVRDARLRVPGWRANLTGANLWRANLSRANLSRAYLSGATIDGRTLTGKRTTLGEAAGYPVLMFATDDEHGHVLRAGCWAGVLDDAAERAVEESDSEYARIEAEAVVAHGRVILDAWKRGV
jgi:hypothetical protein